MAAEADPRSEGRVDGRGSHQHGENESDDGSAEGTEAVRARPRRSPEEPCE